MIDETRIRENLEVISFPRLSGTDHEENAFSIVKNKIEQLNLEPSVQNFSFTSFYPRIYQKVVFVLSFLALLILYLNFEGIFTYLSLIIILTIFLPFLIITRKPDKIRIGKEKISHNLYVKIPGNLESSEVNNDQDNDRSNFLFLSHLDSKGQRLRTNYRVFFFKTWINSLIVCSIVIFIKNLILVQYSYWLLIIGVFPLIINFIAVIVLCYNTTNNKSPGAIDNASGIACVLELLNFYLDSKNRLKNYNLWFIFTGAEECGTMGIRHLYEKIKHLDRTKTFFLLFDTIGGNIDVITGKRGAFFLKILKTSQLDYISPKELN